MLENENNLINMCQQGHVESFEILIKSYEKRAFNIAYRMLGNMEDANDATQEAFIKVFKNMSKFKGDSSFSTWLYRIVTNTCLDIIRKNKNKKVVSYDNTKKTDDGEIKIEFEDEKNNTEEIIEKKLENEFIHECINSLGKDHRAVIVLRDINGFTYKEMTKVLKCSEGTIKSRINRARKSLKNIIEDKRELFKDKIV